MDRKCVLAFALICVIVSNVGAQAPAAAPTTTPTIPATATPPASPPAMAPSKPQAPAEASTKPKSPTSATPATSPAASPPNPKPKPETPAVRVSNEIWSRSFEIRRDLAVSGQNPAPIWTKRGRSRRRPDLAGGKTQHSVIKPNKYYTNCPPPIKPIYHPPVPYGSNPYGVQTRPGPTREQPYSSPLLVNAPHTPVVNPTIPPSPIKPIYHLPGPTRGQSYPPPPLLVNKLAPAASPPAMTLASSPPVPVPVSSPPFLSALEKSPPTPAPATVRPISPPVPAPTAEVPAPAPALERSPAPPGEAPGPSSDSTARGLPTAAVESGAVTTRSVQKLMAGIAFGWAVLMVI